jgi:hypothetical protein
VQRTFGGRLDPRGARSGAPSQPWPPMVYPVETTRTDRPGRERPGRPRPHHRRPQARPTINRNRRDPRSLSRQVVGSSPTAGAEPQVTGLHSGRPGVSTPRFRLVCPRRPIVRDRAEHDGGARRRQPAAGAHVAMESRPRPVETAPDSSAPARLRRCHLRPRAQPGDDRTDAAPFSVPADDGCGPDGGSNVIGDKPGRGCRVAEPRRPGRQPRTDDPGLGRRGHKMRVELGRCPQFRGWEWSRPQR